MDSQKKENSAREHTKAEGTYTVIRQHKFRQGSTLKQRKEYTEADRVYTQY